MNLFDDFSFNIENDVVCESTDDMYVTEMVRLKAVSEYKKTAKDIKDFMFNAKNLEAKNDYDGAIKSVDSAIKKMIVTKDNIANIEENGVLNVVGTLFSPLTTLFGVIYPIFKICFSYANSGSIPNQKNIGNISKQTLVTILDKSIRNAMTYKIALQTSKRESQKEATTESVLTALESVASDPSIDYRTFSSIFDAVYEGCTKEDGDEPEKEESDDDLSEKVEKLKEIFDKLSNDDKKVVSDYVNKAITESTATDEESLFECYAEALYDALSVVIERNEGSLDFSQFDHMYESVKYDSSIMDGFDFIY